VTTIIEVTTEQRDSYVTVALRGELDLSTVHRVDDELKRVEADEPPIVALDLRELSFLDSTGLRMIVTADQRAREAGRRLAIIKGPEPVQRVFEITRLAERLDMREDDSDLAV
jgi:anti-anti-sigma factor